MRMNAYNFLAKPTQSAAILLEVTHVHVGKDSRCWENNVKVNVWNAVDFETFHKSNSKYCRAGDC